MTPLPRWADVPAATPLLASILRDPPETRITRGTWIEGGGQVVYRTYHRPDVAALKRLFGDWWEANYDKPDRGPVERPDALIERLLSERSERRRAA